MAKERQKRKSSTRHAVFLPPNPAPNALVDRDEWIAHAVAGFASNSRANRAIYQVMLETLWPKGHGIPGPVIDRESIRSAVDAAKGRPYLDVFRRLRELQGDEGFLGIVKQGKQYQLIDLNIYAKKTPRTHLTDDTWRLVITHYNNACAVCGSTLGEMGFQQDHKVPRARGGTDAPQNWQPLCDACNTIKSVSCRACASDCTTCGWAYPEFYKPILLPSPTLRALHQYADERKLDASRLVSEWIHEKINRS